MARSADSALPGAVSVRVAVWGCGHGTLDRVYEAISRLEEKAGGRKVELLICCGDFQANRNEHDLECMACPRKYRMMCDFYKYYSGARTAPVLTIFVGGNHEASNYMAELPFGGWVAPNIYYLGTSGVVVYRGLRIGGVSGIYKRYNFREGYYEVAPYTPDTERSINHMREFDLWRLSHLDPSAPAGCHRRLDAVLSHDWPEGVYRHGDVQGLLRRKQHFAEEVAAGALGNPETAMLLRRLQPRYWFSAHLHVKFAAVIPHATDAGGGGGGGAAANSTHAATNSHGACPSASTYFLALDKCLPGRQFLQVIDMPLASVPLAGGSSASAAAAQDIDIDDEIVPAVGSGAAPEPASAIPAAATAAAAASDGGGAIPSASDCGGGGGGLGYDPEWLAVLRKTHALLPTGRRYAPLPAPVPVSAAEVAEVCAMLLRTHCCRGPAAACNGGAPGAPLPHLPVPLNFQATVPAYAPAFPGAESQAARPAAPPRRLGNPQTDALLAALGLAHVTTVPYVPGTPQAAAPPPTAAAVGHPYGHPGAAFFPPEATAGSSQWPGSALYFPQHPFMPGAGGFAPSGGGGEGGFGYPMPPAPPPLMPHHHHHQQPTLPPFRAAASTWIPAAAPAAGSNEPVSVAASLAAAYAATGSSTAVPRRGAASFGVSGGGGGRGRGGRDGGGGGGTGDAGCGCDAAEGAALSFVDPEAVRAAIETEAAAAVLEETPAPAAAGGRAADPSEIDLDAL